MRHVTTKQLAFATAAVAVSAMVGVAMTAVEGHTGTTKNAGFAIISATRVAIGRNVLVEGAVGARYGTAPGELEHGDGNPLAMDSDFLGLDDGLDSMLDLLYAGIVVHDVNGDNRLAVDHPVEQLGLIGAPELVDADGDRHVDDFDLFLTRYDANADGRVVYDAELAGGLAEELPDVNDALARMIDEATPDRNRDGRVTAADCARGYRDGVLDGQDRYAKVRGRLVFAAAQGDWEDALGASYQTIVQGPIRTGHADVDPVLFEAAQPDLPEITNDLLDPNLTWFHDEAQSGAPFGTYDARSNRWGGQVGTELRGGGTYEPAGPDTWESVPFGSPKAYEYYQRQIFRDMTFTNFRIPIGTNALFDHCVFVGVTWIETNEDCDPNWNYAGAVQPVHDGGGDIVYELRFPDLVAETSDGTVIADTRTESNNLRFHGCTFVGTITGDVPDELTHWRNVIQFTGARFVLGVDDVGLATSDDDAHDVRTIVRALDPADRAELSTSSVLMPGWPVGFDNTGESGTTKLTGLIVAAWLDVRGAMDVHGTLLLTFRPVEGEGPLFYGGHPAAFATRLGADGSATAITVRTDPAARLPLGVAIPFQP